MNLLQNKQILLAVTGSIAAYKAPNIAREFIKAGANVRIVMSHAAQRFISPLTFEAITGNAVLTDENESWSNDLNHIGFAKWAELIIIAPATANTINKISNGIADNVLTQVVLASKAKKLIAPSANTQMIDNHFTDSALKLLKLNDFEVVTESGFLACKDIGIGRLANEQRIFWLGARMLLAREFWRYRGVVISSGATIEPIDSVRAITNHSSGKMALSLAYASFVLGADVCVVGSATDELLPICNIKTSRSNELATNLQSAIREAKKGVLSTASLSGTHPTLIKKKPLLLMVAAVSDYIAKNPQVGKLKKEALGEHFKLDLIKNQDILKNLDKNGIFSVGFKAEFYEANGFSNAQKMKTEKNLDAVCLNILGKDIDFGSNSTKIDLISKENKSFVGEKLEVAIDLINAFESIIDE